MKTDLTHLPEPKQQELETIVRLVRIGAKVEMVILFGSYARGDHVAYDAQFDRDTGRKTAYKSDFDILIIVRSENLAEDVKVWGKVENQITRSIHTPISLIIEDIAHVNEMLSVGRYFYADIKKEGICLYDSKRFNLARARQLDDDMKKMLAEEDHKIWFPKSLQIFKTYQYQLDNKFNNLAAFSLHQVTEALLTAASLVLTTYKPKTHDLEKLVNRMAKREPAFASIFPRKTKKEKRLFELLRKAYVDARYSKGYKIT